jgi:Ca2+-binding EF-hand superfamily protein
MHRQTPRFFTFVALISLAVGCFVGSSSSVSAQPKTCTALAAHDRDQDGTLDLAEAREAASALFDKLDADKDNTLDAKELKGRLTAGRVRANDPDHDGTLDKTEYLAIVEARFNAANSDKDGTIDCKEAGTKAGKVLLQVLR